MKKLIICIGILSSSNLFSYEWFQLTNTGIFNRRIEVKNTSQDFDGIKFENTKLSEADSVKKFSHIKDPKKIILIGDTGCRLKEKGDKFEYQNCNDEKEWQFQSVVDSSLKENADLVIHVGDYHYREKCSKPELCKKFTNAVGYGWDAWELDFFKPMDKLLKQAPIIISRGNHEDCNRAFMGYKKFLFNEEWKEKCIDYEAAQLIKFQNFGILNIDTSNLPDEPTTAKELETLWVNRLNEMSKEIKTSKLTEVWVVTHKPVYGMFPLHGSYLPTNVNFKNYFEKSELAKDVHLLLAGHIHTSLVAKAINRPTQVVLGNSGTSLDDFQKDLKPEAIKAMGLDSAKVINQRFGYAVFTKNAKNHWEISFKDNAGKVLETTELDAK